MVNDTHTRRRRLVYSVTQRNKYCTAEFNIPLDTLHTDHLRDDFTGHMTQPTASYAFMTNTDSPDQHHISDVEVKGDNPG